MSTSSFSSEACFDKVRIAAWRRAPEHLTSNQAVRLEMIAKSDNQLYRAYLLKEKLRLIFQIDDVDEAEKELIAWVKWARHCRIPEFVELQRKIMRHKDHILNTIRFDVSNARIEVLPI